MRQNTPFCLTGLSYDRAVKSLRFSNRYKSNYLHNTATKGAGKNILNGPFTCVSKGFQQS